MKSQPLRIFSVCLLLLASLASTGCLLQPPAPDVVMTRFTKAMSEITSFHYDLRLDLSGGLNLNLIPNLTHASINLTGDAINKDPNSPKFTLTAKLTGTAPSGDMALDGELINLDDYTYFRLTNLVVPTLLPVSLGADSQWYKIRHVPTTSDDQKLGIADRAPLSAEQFEAVRNLLAQTPLMEVVEVMMDETVNNQRSYHYRVRLLPDAVSSVGQELNRLLGTNQPVDDLTQLTKYQAEIWINKRTFQLSQLKVADIYLRDNIPVAFDMTLGLARHNEQFKITTPKANTEVNPANLLKKEWGL